MICENCGRVKEENENVCTTCGFDEKGVVKQKKSGKRSAFILKIIYCVIGIASGVFCLVKGIGFYVLVGMGGPKCTFGADFYTEIHDVTKQLAFNTCGIGYGLEDFAKAFLIFAGLFAIAFFNLKLISRIENKNKE